MHLPENASFPKMHVLAQSSSRNQVEVLKQAHFRGWSSESFCLVSASLGLIDEKVLLRHGQRGSYEVREMFEVVLLVVAIRSWIFEKSEPVPAAAVVLSYRKNTIFRCLFE